MGVHRDGAHALGGKLVVLVLHQGDERADDDRKTRQQECGKLIDQRLSASRRHHYQCVTTRENGVERFPLAPSELLMAKAIPEQLAG